MGGERGVQGVSPAAQNSTNGDPSRGSSWESVQLLLLPKREWSLQKEKTAPECSNLYIAATTRGLEQIVIKVHKQHQADGPRYFARSAVVRHVRAHARTHTQAITQLNTWFPAGFWQAEIKMAIWVSAFFQFNIILNLMSLLWGLRSDKRVYRNRFRPLWKSWLDGQFSLASRVFLFRLNQSCSKKIKWAYTSNEAINN